MKEISLSVAKSTFDPKDCVSRFAVAFARYDHNMKFLNRAIHYHAEKCNMVEQWRQLYKHYENQVMQFLLPAQMGARGGEAAKKKNFFGDGSNRVIRRDILVFIISGCISTNCTCFHIELSHNCFLYALGLLLLAQSS